MISTHKLRRTVGGAPLPDIYWYAELTNSAGGNWDNSQVSVNGNRVAVLVDQGNNAPSPLTDTSGFVAAISSGQGEYVWGSHFGYESTSYNVSAPHIMGRKRVAVDSAQNVYTSWRQDSSNAAAAKFSSTGSLIEQSNFSSVNYFSLICTSDDAPVISVNNNTLMAFDPDDMTSLDIQKAISGGNNPYVLAPTIGDGGLVACHYTGVTTSVITVFAADLSLTYDKLLTWTPTNGEIGTYTCIPIGVAVDASDNIFTGHAIYQSIEIGEETIEYAWLVLSKWNSSGSKVWSVRVDGTYSTGITDLNGRVALAYSSEGDTLFIIDAGFSAGGNTTLAAFDGSDGSCIERINITSTEGNTVADSADVCADADSVYISWAATHSGSARLRVCRLPLDLSIDGTFGNITITTISTPTVSATTVIAISEASASVSSGSNTLSGTPAVSMVATTTVTQTSELELT